MTDDSHPLITKAAGCSTNYASSSWQMFSHHPWRNSKGKLFGL